MQNDSVVWRLRLARPHTDCRRPRSTDITNVSAYHTPPPPPPLGVILGLVIVRGPPDATLSRRRRRQQSARKKRRRKGTNGDVTKRVCSGLAHTISSAARAHQNASTHAHKFSFEQLIGEGIESESRGHTNTLDFGSRFSSVGRRSARSTRALTNRALRLQQTPARSGTGRGALNLITRRAVRSLSLAGRHRGPHSYYT